MSELCERRRCCSRNREHGKHLLHAPGVGMQGVSLRLRLPAGEETVAIRRCGRIRWSS